MNTLVSSAFRRKLFLQSGQSNSKTLSTGIFHASVGSKNSSQLGQRGCNSSRKYLDIASCSFGPSFLTFRLSHFPQMGGQQLFKKSRVSAI